MRVKVDPSLQSLSGRWSKKDSTVIALNKHTGKMHQYVMNSEPKASNTDEQQLVRTSFKTKIQVAATWWAANKPSTTNTTGTADYKKVLAAYNNQYKYGNIFIFVRSLVSGTTPAVQVPGGSSSSSNNSGSGNSGNTGGSGDDDDNAN